MKLIYRWLKIHLLYCRCDAPKGAIVVTDPTPDSPWLPSDFRLVAQRFEAMS